MTFPNHSPLTLGFGNLTMNILIGGINVGTAQIDNILAPPGTSYYPARGILNFDIVVQNAVKILAAEADALQKGNLDLTATGNASTFNAVHIPYMEAVLGDAELTAQVPLGLVVAETIQGWLTDPSTIPR